MRFSPGKAWTVLTLAGMIIAVLAVPGHGQSLAEAARKAKKDKKTTKKVFTNEDLQKLKESDKGRVNLFPERTSQEATPTTSAETSGEEPSGPMADLEKQLKDLENQKKEKIQERERLNKELADLEAQINSSNAVYMSTNFGDLVAKRVELRKKIAEINQAIEDLDRKIEDVRIQLEEMKQIEKTGRPKVILEEESGENPPPSGEDSSSYM